MCDSEEIAWNLVRCVFFAFHRLPTLHAVNPPQDGKSSGLGWEQVNFYFLQEFALMMIIEIQLFLT